MNAVDYPAPTPSQRADGWARLRAILAVIQHREVRDARERRHADNHRRVTEEAPAANP